jgi:lambda family phage portal protein
VANTHRSGFISRAVRAIGNGFAAARRSLTSDSTLAQLGGSAGNMGFQAAKITRLNANWPSASRSADQDLVIDLRKLRARARHQAINNPIAAKYMSMVRTNVAGHNGVKLVFKVPSLRKSSKGSGLDDGTNEKLRQAWAEWCRKGSCTVCGRYSWRELQGLLCENIARDGEVLLRKVYVPKSVNPFGFQLQLIDADQLDDTYNLIGRADGTEIRMGVEVDANKRPIAYHLFNGNPYEVSFGSAQRVRVPANQIIHWFIAHRTGQTRGYPWMAASMGQLQTLGEYFEAELAAADMQASLIMSVEDKEGGEAAAEEIEGDGINPDGSKAMDIGKGSAIDLTGTGSTLKNNTPTHPNNAFDSFVKRSGKLAASGSCVPYHSLFSDLEGVNYSSARIGELEVRDFWMELQSSLIENVLQEVYDPWLGSALLNGTLDLALSDRKRFTGTAIRWEPRRWAWTDPLKEIQANTLIKQNGFDTHRHLLASVGLDLEETFEELAYEQDLADKFGLVLGTDIRGQQTSEVNNSDNPEDDEGAAKDGAEKSTVPVVKPAKPKAPTKPAPAKPKPRTLERGMHPANAALWNLTEDEK